MDGGNISPEIPKPPIGNSPFNQPERHSERSELFMGQERRIPVWDDIEIMVKASEEDGREYGMAITRDPENLVPPLIEYLRGSEYSIVNGHGKRRPYGHAIFFHAHPSSATPEGEVTSILTSGNDVDATIMNDFGGGYLNIASVNGVTLHIGTSIIDKESQLPSGIDNFRFLYSIENGSVKGARMETHEQIVEVLKQIQQTRLPFVYSMSVRIIPIKYYFFHIPWSHVDLSISFYGLCFGEGLAKMLATLEDLPEIPQFGSLIQVMTEKDQIEKQVRDRMFEERKRYIEEMRSRQSRRSRLLRWLRIRQ